MYTQDKTLPVFGGGEWKLLSLLRQVKNSKYKDGAMMSVKNAINEGLKKKMDAKFDANGKIKRPSWYLNKELVLSMIIDPRFRKVF